MYIVMLYGVALEISHIIINVRINKYVKEMR